MDQPLEFRVKRLHKMESGGSVKAFVDIAINESFLLKGIRIVKGKNGLFVSMPREKGRDGRWYETVHLMNPLVKDRVSSLVLSTYKDVEL
jgi:stage V sporulation protein G